MQLNEFSNIEEYEVIAEEKEKINWREKLVKFLESRYFWLTVTILLAIIAFFLGRVSGLQNKNEPIKINNASPISAYIKEKTENNSPLNPSVLKEGNSEQIISGVVVASKNGTKYHYPWCAGAKKISAKNLISFNSIAEARTAGYLPANNCKGLK